MKLKHGLLTALIAMAAWPAVSAATAEAPVTRSAPATCADHPNQASAQRAKDTRDADGDGIYCEFAPPVTPRRCTSAQPPATTSDRR